VYFVYQAEVGIGVWLVTGVQSCALPIFFQCSADDRAVLDSEESQFAFPAFEGFSVEQSLRAALICAGGYEQKREKKDRKRRDESMTGLDEHNHLSFVSARHAR